jgi:hypothetical protein
MSTFDVTTRRIGDLSSFEIAHYDDRLLIWGDERPGQVWVISEDSELTQTIYTDPEASTIVTAKESDGALIVVHRDGRVVLLREGSDQGVSFESPGVRDAVWDRDVGLVVARSRTELLDSSLLLVDLSTGETAAIDGDAFLTDQLSFDHRKNILFAVSLVGDHSEPSTVIRRYSGANLSTQRVVWQESGEFTPATVHWDSDGEALYAALDGRPLMTLAGTSDTGAVGRRFDTRAVAVNRSVVATANADGSVSIYWKGTTSHLADVFLIDDGWIFATDRHYLVSDRDLAGYISLAGAESEDAVERQELQLPLLLRPDQ